MTSSEAYHQTSEAYHQRCSEEYVLVNPLKLSKNVSAMKFFLQSCRFILTILKSSIAHFFLGICCILLYSYFSKQTWLKASEKCSQGFAICNYSKTSETKKCLHIRVHFYIVVSQTCNFVNNEY